MHPVFLCGPWAERNFRARIAGRDDSIIAALLPDHALRLDAEIGPPFIVSRTGGSVEGLLVHLDTQAITLLSRLQDVFAAQPMSCTLNADGRPITALIFKPSVAPEGREHWQTDWPMMQSAVFAAALCELVGLAQTQPTEALRARWPLALSHAASRLRAQSDPAPATLRRDGGTDDIVSMQQHQPYAWFFAVREDDLRFRRFDGDFSRQVRRAAFLMSDAVTVLPYDPMRDRVMVIEQFRYGTWLRGAANAWLLEPIAGRVDPFETPEDAALREAQEEARLSLRADGLRAVGHVYPSPGAVTEFLYQYVALCDLPDGAEGVAGLESESENIRSHLIGFDQLMGLLTSGEVQNGPLALATWWLAAHRAQLQG